MGVREATEHGPIAPQPVDLLHDDVFGMQGRSTRFMDEDCLTFTFWSPGTDDARRPVLVWIHDDGRGVLGCVPVRGVRAQRRPGRRLEQLSARTAGLAVCQGG
jgi:hypothetical protein